MSQQLTAASAEPHDMSGKLDELRVFIDRRFAELSTELHATVQMVDYSEENLSGQLTAMRDQLSAVLALPASSTRNSGIELETVVQVTESAANQIMEAAEAIGDWLLEIAADPALRERINDKVNAIFEACSFQDLTSQRIRRAIDHLHQVETMLGTISSGGRPAELPSMKLLEPGLVVSGPDLAQASIDAMMADF
jgi:chemotaxis protein CheZ